MKYFRGLSVLSPILGELQCKPIPTLDNPSIHWIQNNKPYIGGPCGIFSLLSIGVEHIFIVTGQ